MIEGLCAGVVYKAFIEAAIMTSLEKLEEQTKMKVRYKTFRNKEAAVAYAEKIARRYLVEEPALRFEHVHHAPRTTMKNATCCKPSPKKKVFVRLIAKHSWPCSVCSTVLPEGDRVYISEKYGRLCAFCADELEPEKMR